MLHLACQAINQRPATFEPAMELSKHRQHAAQPHMTGECRRAERQQGGDCRARAPPAHRPGREVLARALPTPEQGTSTSACPARRCASDAIRWQQQLAGRRRHVLLVAATSVLQPPSPAASPSRQSSAPGTHLAPVRTRNRLRTDAMLTDSHTLRIAGDSPGPAEEQAAGHPARAGAAAHR